MSRLEIRLLGGFEAKLAGRPAQKFESQKARALLGFLVLNRDQAVRRDQLAGLFWPDRPDEGARRNLRQALYSIRNTLGDESQAFSVLQSERDTVRLHPDLDCWVDVSEFRKHVRSGLADSGADPYHLTEAVSLYKGDLLAGFFLRGCVQFEEWLVTEQERVREEALQTFRALVEIYLARGEHRYGIRYAKRLLAVDPLSEETHRQLMTLYLMAGRRNRALAQYEQLLNLLVAELGVEPLDETQDLYRSILLQNSSETDVAEEEESTPPIIPLVGRDSQFQALQDDWHEVLEKRGRLTLVTGESGVGKSRLVKSIVDRSSSKRDSVVLRGRSYAAAPLVPFRSIAEAIRSIFSDVLADEPESVDRLSDKRLSELALLCPELQALAPSAVGRETDPSLASPSECASSFLELLDIVSRHADGEPRPVIFLLEDLDRADDASLAVLRTIIEATSSRPVWLLATARDTQAMAPLLELAGDSGSTIQLERFAVSQVEEVAKALVDLASAPVLTNYLWEASAGLPLAVTELINLLWDERVLIQQGPGRWALRSDPHDVEPPAEIGALIDRRFRRMPNSARRLLSLAAVLGHQFDVEILTAAGDEHLSVVETAMQLALERWLIRQFPLSWSKAEPERDIVLWARGARRGFFEFSHRAIRAAILEHINPVRRLHMHGEAARALAAACAEDRSAACEDVAFHFVEAGELEEARPWLELAAAKSEAAGAIEISKSYREKVAAIPEPRTDRGKVIRLRRDAPS